MLHDRYVHIIFYYLAFILRLFLIRCFPLLLFADVAAIAQETFLSKGEFNFQQQLFWAPTTRYANEENLQI